MFVIISVNLASLVFLCATNPERIMFIDNFICKNYNI